MSDTAIGFLVFLGLVLICIGVPYSIIRWAESTRPECAEGYVPMRGKLTGWVCIPGYKP